MPKKFKYIFVVTGIALLLILIVYLVYDQRLAAMEHEILQPSP
jgi:hypothetical protein